MQAVFIPLKKQKRSENFSQMFTVQEFSLLAYCILKEYENELLLKRNLNCTTTTLNLNLKRVATIY